MKTVIVDESTNEYLSRMFLAPLLVYLRVQGWQADVATSPDGIANSLVIVHGDTMSPERIQQIKNSGNKLCIFDINDSSYLSSAYIHTPEQALVDLIFKVSGVPRQNEINETNLTRNFDIVVSREKYLPDPQWAQFEAIRPKIRPLPYVLWEPLVGRDVPVVPAAERSGKVLVRGGNHFWRVILFFRLMQEGLLDDRSEFHTSAYFSETMEQRFQFCASCKAERQAHGRSLYDAAVRREECNSPVTGWELPGEFFGGPMYGRHEHGYWNNRCPHSFFFLAKEFERLRGPLNHDFIERAFNGDMRPQLEFIRDLSHASFAGDCKQLNTINLPPRFWEAASLGTPSLYAERVGDQDYWPPITEGVHFFKYGEGMNDFAVDVITSDWWTDASAAVKDLYETKIRGTDYAISNALLEYMKTNIEEHCL